MRASVVISDYSSKGNLATCLTALCTQSAPVEVVLPDLGNLSREDASIVASLEQQHPHFRVVRRPGLNRAEMLSEAVEQATGDVLLFIESHCIPPHDWAKAFLDRFERGGVEAASGPVRVVPSDNVVSRCEGDLNAEVRQNIARAGLAESYLDFHSTGLSRECFRRFGLHPRLPALCEFDLGARLHAAGVPVERIEAPPVGHVNDMALGLYARGIAAQGMDRTRILLVRGPEFVARYFPAPRFVRLFRWLRLLRLPLLAAYGALRAVESAAFHAAAALGAYPVAYFFFRRAAARSLRLGQLATTGEAP